MLIFWTKWNLDIIACTHSIHQDIILFYIGCSWQFFGSGELRGWPLWVKVTDHHMLDTAISRQLHNRPTKGHIQARLPNLWHLWKKTFMKGQNAAQVFCEEKSEKQPREHQSWWSRGRRRGAADAREEIPLQLVERNTTEQITTLQPTPWRTPHRRKWVSP